MKIKSIISEEEKKIYNDIRFNPNTIGTHIQIQHGIENLDKKEYAISIIFTLMSINGYLDDAKNQSSEQTPLSIINTMINIANRNIDSISLNNETANLNYEINDIITFNNGNYILLDIIKKDKNAYLYLINSSETENDISINKIENNNGIIKYSHIEDDSEFNFVLNKLFLDFKNEMVNFAIEE